CESIRQLAMLWASRLTYAPQGIAARLAELALPWDWHYIDDLKERTDVIRLLGKFAADPKASLPVLSVALKERDPAIRSAAIEALRAFGAKAAPVLPQLLDLFAKSDPATQQQLAE